MGSFRESFKKRLYTFRLARLRQRSDWRGQYWTREDGFNSIACRNCPKFSASDLRCTVPFGSPLRKCVTAAIEANLRSLSGKNVLEVGFGRHSIVRSLVKSAGGTWTGIDPSGPRRNEGRLGCGGYGIVADIPFPDSTFDVVVGVQTFEHWAEELLGRQWGHEAGVSEVWRVLNPGGLLYLDAPIHLHGHEMFIVGDVDRIRGLFDAKLWTVLALEKWRQDYRPLERYAPPERDRSYWGKAVTSYSTELLQDIASNRSVHLLTISATKRLGSPPM